MTLNDTEIAWIQWCILITLIFVGVAFFYSPILWLLSKSKSIVRFLRKYNRYKWNVAFSVGILSAIIIFWRLLAYTFNQGELYRVRTDTLISTEMSDWGGFATCLTSIFALISVYLAFKALRSQTIAARRASFDATFTQIFAQHNILHRKVTQHNVLCKKITLSNIIIARCRAENASNLFTMCREAFENEYLTEKSKISISDFRKKYNNAIGLCPSADFKNYFKYIHREVSFVMYNSKDILEPEDLKRYVKLIEGQMNNDELFCYFINQLEYWISHKKEKEVRRYVNFLKTNEFFKEICLTEHYQPLITEAWNISTKDIKDGDEPLIEKEWLYEKAH